MLVTVTLTSASINTGPFNLYTNVDSYSTPINVGVSRTSLLAGFTTSNAPDTATIIRVQSTGACTGFIDMSISNLPSPTPTPTVTLTNTLTPTTTVTSTNTSTPTRTPASITPTPTNTSTQTPSNTATPTQTGTPNVTTTPTNTPTQTATAAVTPTQTSTATVTPSPTTPCYGFNLTPVYDTTCDRSGDDVTAYKTTAGSIIIGDTLYNSCGGTTLLTGFYSDGTYRYVVNVGEVTNKIDCVAPTTTQTPTQTQTPTNTQTQTPTSLPLVWNLYFPCDTTNNATQVIAYTPSYVGGEIIKGSNGLCYKIALTGRSLDTPITVVSEHSTCADCNTPATSPTPTTTTTATPTSATSCRTYQIVGYNLDEYVNGTYTNCAGFPDSFSFFGGPGVVGSVCAQSSTVVITSGNGGATDTGSC